MSPAYSFAKLLIAVPLLLGSVSAATSATIKSELGDYEGTIYISGAIEPGDLRRILQALGDREGGKGAPIYLSLNSRGGYLPEALKIADLSLEKNLSTRLDANAECLGPCAIIFMTGTSLSTIGPQLGRHMHPTAILGFQAPSLASSGADGESGEKAYAAAVHDIEKFLKVASFRSYAWLNPLIKMALAQEMMAREGREYYFIDTVRKAAEFEIELENATGPDEVGEFEAKHGCENAVATVANSDVADGFAEFSGEGTKAKGDDGETTYDFRWSRGYCKVSGSAPYRFFGVAEYRGNELGVSGPDWMFWPGSKALVTVPTAKQ